MDVFLSNASAWARFGNPFATKCIPRVLGMGDRKSCDQMNDVLAQVSPFSPSVVLHQEDGL